MVAVVASELIDQQSFSLDETTPPALDPRTHVCNERTIEYATARNRYITCACGRRWVLHTTRLERGSISRWVPSIPVSYIMPGGMGRAWWAGRNRQMDEERKSHPPDPVVSRGHRMRMLDRAEEDRREKFSETEMLFHEYQAAGGGKKRDGSWFSEQLAARQKSKEKAKVYKPVFSFRSMFR